MEAMKLVLLAALVSVSAAETFSFSKTHEKVTYNLKVTSTFTSNNSFILGTEVTASQGDYALTIGNTIAYTKSKCGAPLQSVTKSIKFVYGGWNGIAPGTLEKASTQSSTGYSQEIDLIAAFTGAVDGAIIKALGIKGLVTVYLDDIRADGYSFNIVLALDFPPLGAKTTMNVAHDFVATPGASDYVANCTGRCKADGVKCFSIGTGASVCSDSTPGVAACQVSAGGYGKGWVASLADVLPENPLTSKTTKGVPLTAAAALIAVMAMLRE